MKLRWRFSFRLLVAMLLVAVLSAVLSTYALYYITRRLVEFTADQSGQASQAQSHAAELFRAYFADRKDEFRRRAKALGEANVVDMATLAQIPGLLRARLLEGDEVLDGWEAEPP